MADITVFGNKSKFNEDAEFFKDVYIYGKLYYDDLIGKGAFDNLRVNGDGYFGGDVYIEGNLNAGIITAREKLDVGVGGTILTTSDGRIGIGTTNPSQNFEVIGSAFVSNSVGIGSTLPERKLDVAGSVKIAQDIYDAANNPGVVGAFLTKDAQGIKWTAFEPSFTEGIFVYNDGVLVGPGSYRGLNLKTGNIATEGIRNSSPGLNVGIVTDTIQTFVSPLNPDIADIYVFDAWEIDPVSFNVYRNSRVGIQNPNPVYDLDVNGTVYINETLDVNGATSLNDTLDVDGATTLNSTLDVDGGTTLNSTLDVDGATTLNNTLNVSSSTTLSSTLVVSGSTSINNTLDVSGQTTLSSTLDVGSSTTLNSTLDVDGDTTLNSTLDVDGATTLNSTLDVDGGTTLNSILDVDGATTLNSTLDVDGATTINNTLTVSSDTALQTTLKVGAAGTVITTTNSGFIGLGTNNPLKPIDATSDLIIRKRLYDSNENVGYDTSFYKPPRAVLTQVGIGTTGEIIGGRFFDAANMIRLNLDFIAAEAVGFITSTDYKNPAFIVPGSGGVSTCRSDIKKILKAITLDITKGGNSQSVGAGLSYYNGGSLIHITGNDINGYSIKTATIDAIKKAAEFSRYVINNVSLPKSYQSGVTSVRQIKDLTLQNDPSVGVNTNLNGCANVTSAIYTCAGIVTTIIGNGPSAAPNITYPNGRIVWAPPGADSRNLIWVSKYGNDDNTGSTEGDAKLTIGAACAIAEPGDTVMVRSGVYYENNPIGLRSDVTVSGQDLRLVTVVPLNPNRDVFHVRRGCLIENLNFAGSDISVDHSGCGAVAFPPTLTDINAGKAFRAVTGYTALGPANEGPTGRWRSPYVRNCTNFMTKSIGMKINGNHSVSSTIGADLKCMVCDSFTQYNEAGIGVSITNNGYAQLVSIFTINCDIAIYCDTGGQCDLTNSNSSFGNYGLYAVGLGATEFTGKVNTTTLSESDVIVFKDVSDGSQPRRPYDGQALYFKINLENYTTGQTGILTSPLRRLKAINVINGGSGYSPSSPPDITLYDYNTGDTVPLGPEGIIAEVSPTIDPISGAITVVDIINSGRNYLPTQDMRVRLNGIPTNDLVAVMEPIYYTVGSATSVTSAGITTVTLNEFVPYFVYENDEIEMRRISRILTSGHSFEYIGTGTDINTSTPLKGAVPIKENEIVYLDGAQIPYTSTDQQGNFNIGEGIQINQNTSTITGRDFSKAIQAEVTPLILALR
jgi:acyl-[acyl carrier protein]--UDP-N-acetylglucosamine O-acyltransferase